MFNRPLLTSLFTSSMAKTKKRDFNYQPVAHPALRGSIVSRGKYILWDGNHARTGHDGLKHSSASERVVKRETTRVMRRHHKQECAIGLHEWEQDVRDAQDLLYISMVEEYEESQCFHDWLYQCEEEDRERAERAQEERDAEAARYDYRDDYYHMNRRSA